ncbi:hypothetical protein F0562_025802 [Nyssa sinensis]|uniref:Uncharacterized protein n=1 Tax=Nyssa sinensis TaxID=561372 RepID=A0A5J5B9I9_9ASTE|nr:hypothetical protein F0562_025802 [Nyssa sinensis]
MDGESPCLKGQAVCLSTTRVPMEKRVAVALSPRLHLTSSEIEDISMQQISLLEVKASIGISSSMLSSA